MKQNNYFNKDGKHYFTEEEKQALQDLINHLEESHKKFWEEWEEQKRIEQDSVEQKSLEKNGDEK